MYHGDIYGYNMGYPPPVPSYSGYSHIPGHGFPPPPYVAPYGPQYHSNIGYYGPENPLAIFRNFDRDGDGRITENDFVIAVRQLGLGSIGESIIRNTFRNLDRNRNGKLDFGEAIGAFDVLKATMGDPGRYGYGPMF